MVPVGPGGSGQNISGRTKGNFNSSYLILDTLSSRLENCPTDAKNCLVYWTKQSTIIFLSILMVNFFIVADFWKFFFSVSYIFGKLFYKLDKKYLTGQNYILNHVF